MSLKFDEASIDRGVRSRRGNFCPPMATHQPPFVSAYVPTVARYLSAFDQHSSRCVYARAAARYAIRISRALSVVNRKRAFTQSRLKASGGSGACPYLVHRSIKFRPALVPPPLTPSRANHMHFERSKRFQISIEILGWHLTVRVVESLASIHLSLSLIRVENTYHRSHHFPVFLNEWNLNGMGRRNACQLPFISGQVEFIRCNVDDSFRIVYYWIVYGGLVWI